MAKNCFRTLAKNELREQSQNGTRGSRFWSSAEILTPTWYVLEACTEHVDKTQVRTWVTSTFYEATQVQRNLGDFLWAHIFVCLRAPLSVRNGTIFEEIVEVHVLPDTGDLVLHLRNGLSFQTRAESGNEFSVEQNSPGQVKLLYTNRQNGCSLA